MTHEYTEDPRPIRSGRPAKGSQAEAEIRELDEVVYAISCQHPEYTVARVHQALVEKFENTPLYDHAVDYFRGVGRALKAFKDPNSPKYKGDSPATKQQYRHYEWPASHADGALPWEATDIGLAIQARQIEPPTVRQIKWAHHLTLSAPDLPWFRPDEFVWGGMDEWNVQYLSGLLEFYELIIQMESTDPSEEPRATHSRGLSYYSPEPEEEQYERASFYEVVADYLRWKPWTSVERYRDYIGNSTVRTRGPYVFMRVAHLFSEKLQRIIAADAEVVKEFPSVIDRFMLVAGQQSRVYEWPRWAWPTNFALALIGDREIETGRIKAEDVVWTEVIKDEAWTDFGNSKEN